ncbi:TetR/AcrR family transcriptional regulator [Streptomyces lacrimifluminis]|uniref:Transcriptional regulator, TetR n=1 Tax=Streptomyces lacrimifluminis TaxID=1500077 RepID=A0A917KNV5_9ACTN|nr:TetR/AcrR family transcriptional regulator [Streptomyces lacrimifluminis]GGJ20940.1 putative transcriptional regulator, TetR [Streptomyces lacrimifluminis]
MGATAESARRPGRPGADTRAVPDEENVLKRGLEAFAELGYDRASARELARRLGVSHNFINDRYGSKAAFWRAVVDFALGAQLAQLPLEEPVTDDAERLRRIVTALYLTSVDTPQLSRLFVDELSRDTERLDYLYEHYIGPTLETLLPSIDRLVAAGRMAPIPKDVLFFAMIPPISGMIDVPLARRLGRAHPATPEQLVATAETLATLVINGLLATTTSDSRR